MKFSVILDNKQAVYYTGQTVKGIVLLELETELKVREHVHLESTILQEGTYKFPFKYNLPKNLPTSYESQIGYIRYVAHATIERPWAFDKHEKKFFSIIEILDLNRIPNMEQVLYHTSTRTTESNHVLARTKHGQIDGPGQDIWRHERLKIPAVPPSYLKHCELIDIQYFVELKIIPKGPGSPFKVQREVIIGTVPLKSTGFSGSRGSTPTFNSNGVHEYDTAHAMFAESSLGRVYNKHVLDRRDISFEIDFVPLYAYFFSENRDATSIFTITKQTAL